MNSFSKELLSQFIKETMRKYSMKENTLQFQGMQLEDYQKISIQYFVVDPMLAGMMQMGMNKAATRWVTQYHFRYFFGKTL